MSVSKAEKGREKESEREVEREKKNGEGIINRMKLSIVVKPNKPNK